MPGSPGHRIPETTMPVNPVLDPTKVKIGQTMHVDATFQADRHSADDVKKLVELALGKAGCPACGRLHRLRIEFLGDPIDKAIHTGIPGIASISQHGF